MDSFVPFWWTQTKSSLTCICKAIAAPTSSLKSEKQYKEFFFATFYLQVNISIISTGKLGILDFTTGNASRQIHS